MRRTFFATFSFPFGFLLMFIFFLAFLCEHVIGDTSGSLSPFSFLLLISIDTCGSYLIFRPLVFSYSLGFLTSDAGEKIKKSMYDLLFIIFFKLPFYWTALCVRLASTMCELPSQPWN